MEDQKIAVFGIGRVGLPLALVLADKGYSVTGVDVDPYRLTLLRHGIMPFMEEGAEELLKKHINKKFQVISQDHFGRVVKDNSILIITLGTPIDDRYSPSFKQVEDLILQMSPFIQKGHLIILRSTISPGTTEYLAKQLEEQTKLTVGKDLFLAYCPERIAEGKSVPELAEIPQIIGALDPLSSEKAGEVFAQVAPEILPTNPRSAELAKLFCNMYRYIDFAIGNEFMMITEDHGCDIYEVLGLVNHGYKRGGLKSPGFTAGPCLVKDGFFLIDKSPYMELVTAAWRINENIPGYLLMKILKMMPDLHRKKVAILGYTFKKDIDDTRYSLAPKMQRHLQAEGADVVVHDPYIDSQSLEEVLKNAKLVILGMNHEAFKNLSLKDLSESVAEDCIICDIWNLFKTGKIAFGLKDYLSTNELSQLNGKASKTKKIDTRPKFPPKSLA